MPSIKHYNTKQLYDEQCTNNILYSTDLVTYSFDGDNVKILKSRLSKTGIISFAEYLDLAKHTLSNKPYYIEEK